MARPRLSTSELKAIQVCIRFTIEEQLFLEETAKIYGVSIVNYIRRRSLKQQLPKFQMTGIDREILIELSKIGNNINQLTRKVNQTNNCDLEELEGMLYFLKDQLDKIKSKIFEY